MSSKVEILNDGDDWVEVKAKCRSGVEHTCRVKRNTVNANYEVVLAMTEEIEELREALELDRDDLREAIYELEGLKRDCENGFTTVLDKLGDRGKAMTA